MKKLKKLSAIILVFVMVFTVIPAVDGKAATGDYQTKFRVYGCSGTAEDTVELTMPDALTYIENVKSSNKNLIAGVTDYRYGSTSEENTQTIGFVAKKQGTYDISYDVMKSGKKVKTVKAKVYAYPAPISVKISGVKTYFYGNKKEGKLSVSATKGNTISKIEVGTYKEIKETYGGINSQIKYTTVKNNSTIKLGTKGYHYEGENEYDNYSRKFMSSNLCSQTYIRVTYKDQYTKQKEEYTAYYQGIAE